MDVQVVSAERPAPAACPHSPTGGADSQDATGQLLTGATLESPVCLYLPSLRGASGGQLLRPRKDVRGGGGGQGVGKQGGSTVMGGLHAFSRRGAARFYNHTLR